MKQLLLRNIKLRKTTLIVYILLIAISPLQCLIPTGSKIGNWIIGVLATIFVVLAIKDSAHLFRFHSKLGEDSYYYQASLPVSKFSLLNANLVTMLIFTALGCLILLVYQPTVSSSKEEIGLIDFIVSYISINFFSMPIAFKRYTEIKSENINYIVYIIIMNFIVPIISILIGGILIAILLMFLLGKQTATNYGEIYQNNFDIVYIIISTIWLLINYYIQSKKVRNK